ncbi:alpha/beta fold hydrolase [Roseovarius sp. CH_XMU1461]|uniref:alpha/beta fold hydrolase n=1 Tax=Roseovarius sp. CH_XMU1461 TaxID=3107777 RepID=UPI003008813C
MSTAKLQTRDGFTLKTRVSGAGIPVVFSNSLGADLSMWDEVVAALDGRVTAVTYDTAGHGGSSNGSGTLTLEALTDHAMAIAERHSEGTFLFCGLSLGGLTGMNLAARKPDALGGMVLANTATAFPPAQMWIDRAEAARVDGMADLVGPTLDRWLTPAFRETWPERAEAIASMIAATPAKGYADCCEVLAASDVSALLPSVSCPTVVIAGEHDPSTPPARAEEIAAGISDARVEIVPAAHLSSLECPDRFAEIILSMADKAQQRRVA